MMRLAGVDKLERYETVGIAIGLIELLGNENPSSHNVGLAEKIVKRLRLTWDDCESRASLSRAIKRSQ